MRTLTTLIAPTVALSLMATLAGGAGGQVRIGRGRDETGP